MKGAYVTYISQTFKLTNVTLTAISFNQNSGHFEAVLADNTHTVQMILLDYNEDQSDQAEKLVSSICDWLNSNLLAVKVFSASKLTEIKNTSWLEEGEEPISEVDFRQKIELDAINVYSEGSFDIFFNVADLFSGHQIIVNVDRDFTLINTEIVG